MSNTRYAIEWIYGEFRIARFQLGECVEFWSAPEPVNDLTGLSQAVYDASQHIDLSRGGDIAIAYEDDYHTHEFVEVPDVSKRDLEKYLQRRVNQKKPFDGEAVWCYHPAKRGQNNNGVLLHIMPKGIVDAVIRICEEYYLLPKRLVPLTEVMSEHIPRLKAAAKDLLLVIAIFDRRVQMVVSHGDGHVLFVRELAFSWKNDRIERLIIEINRTIGFSKQRLGKSPDKVWILGEHALELLDDFKKGLNADVEVDELVTDLAFWVTEVAGLSQRLSSNFIPRLARRAVTRKSTLRIAVAASLCFITTALLISFFVEIEIARKGFNRYELQTQIDLLENKISALNNEINQIEIEKKRLNHLTADAFNLPAIFLSHLGDLVPDGLTLTYVDISREQSEWSVDITGISELSLGEVAPVLTELQLSLTEKPWNTRITQGWQETWMQQLRSGGAVDSSTTGFQITGRLQ